MCWGSFARSTASASYPRECPSRWPSASPSGRGRGRDGIPHRRPRPRACDHLKGVTRAERIQRSAPPRADGTHTRGRHRRRGKRGDRHKLKSHGWHRGLLQYRIEPLGAHISASEGCVQSQSPSSSPAATQDNGHRRSLSDPLALSLSRALSGLSLWMRKWYAVARSFRGHIHIQFSTRTGRVDLGPVFRRQGERYVANERTRARASGIDKLLATFRWADSADRHIFLLGFEAGEEFGKERPTDCSEDSPE